MESLNIAFRERSLQTETKRSGAEQDEINRIENSAKKTDFSNNNTIEINFSMENNRNFWMVCSKWKENNNSKKSPIRLCCGNG